MSNKNKIPDFILNSGTSCFFCYDEIGTVTHGPLLVSLKSVCRLLKINLRKTLSRGGTKGVFGGGVQVSLCEGCWLVSGRFSKLYRELEEVRMKLGICLEAIAEKLKGLKESPKLMEEYRRKLEGDPKAKGHSGIMAELRREIMLKYQSYSKKSQPRVKIKKISRGSPPVPVTIASKKESELRRIYLLRDLIARKDNLPCEKVTVTPTTPSLNAEQAELEAHMYLPQSPEDDIIMVDDDPQPDQVPLIQIPNEDNGRARNLDPVDPKAHPPNHDNFGNKSILTSSANSCPDSGKADTMTVTPDIPTLSIDNRGGISSTLPPLLVHLAPSNIFQGGELRSLLQGPNQSNMIANQEKCSATANNTSFDPNVRLQNPSNSSNQEASPSSSATAPSKPFNCHLCPKSFATVRARSVHVTRTHTMKTILVFDCDICHQSFGSKTDLKMHREAVHTDLIRFVCKYCDRECLTLDSLYHHNMTGCSRNLGRSKVSDEISQRMNFSATFDLDMDEGQAQLYNNLPITIKTVPQPEYPSLAPQTTSNFIQRPQLPSASSIATHLTPTRLIMTSALVPAQISQLAPPPPISKDLDKPASLYPCRLCRDSFVTREGLKNHIKFCHLDDPRLQTMFSDISQRSSNPPFMRQLQQPNLTGSHQYFPCPFCKKVFTSEDWLARHQQLHCQTPNRNGNLVRIMPASPGSCQFQDITTSASAVVQEDHNMDTLQFFRGDDNNQQNQDNNHTDPMNPDSDPFADTDPAEPILEDVIDYDYDMKPGDDPLA